MPRYIRFLSGKAACWGIVEGENVFSISASPLEEHVRGAFAGTMDTLLLLPPCLPGKIIGCAINYEGATGQQSSMLEPMVFFKPSTSVTGPNMPVRNPLQQNTWGEAELAIVIGQRTSRVSEADAMGAIFGYTIANDVSADNLYDWDHHLARSKGADTFCPLGPWIDTGFVPGSQRVEAYQNGELLRRGTLDQRLFGEAALIALLSRWMTLEPWDVILTGAPVRVRSRLYLKDGDEFRCVIEGLGELVNRFEELA